MKPHIIPILKQLALRGSINEYVSISSRELGESLGISQQSSSKRILDLLDQDLISRQLGAKKQLIKLTEKGLDVLRKEYSDYLRLFECYEKVSIRGIVTSGLGEGQYYVTQKGYRKQFQEKLWFDPYEGTLNLKISSNELGKVEILKGCEGIPIDGFEKGGRTFGRGKCFLSKINNFECAIVMPYRSHYSNVIEIISKHYLRGVLDLKDGDEIEVTVSL